MIARTWTGRTRPEDADAYSKYVEKTGVAAQRRTPGNIASLLLRREHDGFCEHVVISLWESEQAIRAFAGDDIDVAVYFPEDRRYLLEMPRLLDHYEVVAYETEQE